MTQVSKRLLKKELEEKIYQTFWEVVAKLNKLDEANLFFSDLFTRAERINFIKRLSIVVLLYKGYDWRQICDLLKVSPNTVAKRAAMSLYNKVPPLGTTNSMNSTITSFQIKAAAMVNAVTMEVWMMLETVILGMVY